MTRKIRDRDRSLVPISKGPLDLKGLKDLIPPVEEREIRLENLKIDRITLVIRDLLEKVSRNLYSMEMMLSCEKAKEKVLDDERVTFLTDKYVKIEEMEIKGDIIKYKVYNSVAGVIYGKNMLIFKDGDFVYKIDVQPEKMDLSLVLYFLVMQKEARLLYHLVTQALNKANNVTMDVYLALQEGDLELLSPLLRKMRSTAKELKEIVKLLEKIITLGEIILG